MIASVFVAPGLESIRSSCVRYCDCTDFEIVERAQRGEDTAAEYLLYKYRNLVRAKVRAYFLIGAETEDLIQVGMIGLWQSIVDFRSERAISFPAFAKLCITRHIITAIKTATRHKQAPLNTSLSMGAPSGDPDNQWNLSEMLPGSKLFDPEEVILRREDTQLLCDIVHQMLSDFEQQVLSGYRTGRSYREISLDLGCNTKSIDNALRRIKRKLADVPVGCADLSGSI